MGKIMSILTRPIRMINIDNRAEKVISQTKPIPAPTYESTKKQLDIAKKLNPTFMEEHYKKDSKLHSNLKQVYVTSQDPEHHIKSQHSSGKSLPELRSSSEEFEYGFWEPKELPPGKISLRIALEILASNALQPKLYNKTSLAKKYNLDPQLVEKLLLYYRIYTKIDPNTPKQDSEPNKHVLDYINDYTSSLIKHHKPKNTQN